MDHSERGASERAHTHRRSATLCLTEANETDDKTVWDGSAEAEDRCCKKKKKVKAVT